MNDTLLYTHPQKDGKYRLKSSLPVANMKVDIQNQVPWGRCHHQGDAGEMDPALILSTEDQSQDTVFSADCRRFKHKATQIQHGAKDNILRVEGAWRGKGGPRRRTVNAETAWREQTDRFR